MKNVLISLSTLLLSSTAMAADLPRRTPAPAPVPIVRDAPVTWYVGINNGIAATPGTYDFNYSSYTLGGLVGYQFNNYLRGEVNFQNRFGTNAGQTATTDLIVQYPFGKIVPYLLGGVGLGWNSFGTWQGNTAAVWSLGAGVRYELNRNWEIDGRYRFTQNFNDSNYLTYYGLNVQNKKMDNNALTVGVNYKF